MALEEGVGRRRITQIFEDLRNRIRYWELEEKAEDRSRWKRIVRPKTDK